jgi:hypothetical protein
VGAAAFYSLRGKPNAFAKVREDVIFLLTFAALAAFMCGIAVAIPQVKPLYKKWTEPVHERAFTIAVDSNQPSDACAEAGSAAGAYLQNGDAAKYRLWKEHEQTWCAAARREGGAQ